MKTQSLNHAGPRRWGAALRWGAAIILSAFLAPARPDPSAATQITLIPSQNSPIYGPDGGVAGVDFVDHSNGAGYTLYVGTNGTGSVRRSLLQFDFSALPPGAVITSAQLVMTVDREPNASNQLISLHQVTTAWTTGTSNSDIIGTPGQGAPATPGDATWYYASWPGPNDPSGVLWNNPGGDYDAQVIASTWVGPMGPNFSPLAYTWSSQGMIDSINAWLQNPASNFGWMMVGNEVQTQSVKRFISRGALDSSGQPMSADLLPHLVLSYIISTTPTSTSGGSGTAATSYTPSPWGRLRRRAGTPRPMPCC